MADPRLPQGLALRPTTPPTRDMRATHVRRIVRLPGQAPGVRASIATASVYRHSSFETGVPFQTIRWKSASCHLTRAMISSTSLTPLKDLPTRTTTATSGS